MTIRWIGFVWFLTPAVMSCSQTVNRHIKGPSKLQAIITELVKLCRETEDWTISESYTCYFSVALNGINTWSMSMWDGEEE